MGYIRARNGPENAMSVETRRIDHVSKNKEISASKSKETNASKNKETSRRLNGSHRRN